MPKISEIISVMEDRFPLYMGESWDNNGLQVGDKNAECKAILTAIDICEEVIDEAIERGANLIITHHPPLFHALKRIDNSNYINRSIIKAIKNDIAIYSAHTTADASPYGLNFVIAKELGLQNIEPMIKNEEVLYELETFVPSSFAGSLSKALWEAGAGKVGNYDSCSFSIEGEGSFRAIEGANPFVGSIGEVHKEKETSISMVLSETSKNAVIKALKENHPYETPAYSLRKLSNSISTYGLGAVGNLEKEEGTESFLKRIKDYFSAEKISYSKGKKEKISRVAICTGAAGSMYRDAIKTGADIFISGEARYNDYFDVEDKIVLATLGHYESEIISARIFADILKEKFEETKVFVSKIDSNPVKYL